MPMTKAMSAIAHGSRRSAVRPRMVSTTRSAPPLSASSLPIIAPSAMSTPMSPVVAPRPLMKLANVFAMGIPASTARRAEPSTSARNVCSLSQVISAMITAMLTSTAVRS